MKRVAMLKHFGVTPVMVFDGAPLPSKLAKEHERLASREQNKVKGMALLRQGKRSKAIDHFQKCIDITPELAFQLVEACRRAGVEVVVAPYEADAQLAHLACTDYVAAVITEDSDLLTFGCKR